MLCRKERQPERETSKMKLKRIVVALGEQVRYHYDDVDHDVESTQINHSQIPSKIESSDLSI